MSQSDSRQMSCFQILTLISLTGVKIHVLILNLKFCWELDFLSTFSFSYRTMILCAELGFKLNNKLNINRVQFKFKN